MILEGPHTILVNMLTTTVRIAYEDVTATDELRISERYELLGHK